MGFKFFNNPYQYTRNISFRADYNKKDIKECLRKRFETNITTPLDKQFESLNDKDQISRLSDSLLEFYKELEKLLYASSNPQKKSFNQKIFINKSWLKIWHKEIFHLYIKKQKANRYSFEGLKKIHEDFKMYLANFKSFSESLKHISKAKYESQFRRSEISDKINGLLSNQGVFYFKSFLNDLHVSYTDLDDKKIQALKELTDIQKKLEFLREKYLPSQSSGLEIARASLNYYTVNRKPKDYKNVLQDTKAKLYNKPSSIITYKNEVYIWKIDNESIFTFKSKQEKEWFKRYRKKNNYQVIENSDTKLHLSLDQTYFMMKSFKAEQKNLFYELTSRVKIIHRNQSNQGFEMKSSQRQSSNGYENRNKKHILYGYSFASSEFCSIDKLSCSFSLFKGDLSKVKKQYYEKFIQLSKDIKSGKDGNLVKERGKYLQDSRQRDRKPHASQNREGEAYFKDYTNFCEKYKKTAQRRGKLKAQIKGIEREKREALQMDYWALIYTDLDKRQLWLIPKKISQKNELIKDKNSSKTNLQLVKDYIENTLKDTSHKKETKYLSCFKSLTMRALHKLCFSEQSSFVKNMPDDLKRLHKSVEKFKTKDKDVSRQKEKQQQKDEKKLQFFKQVLKSEYAKRTLDMEGFNLEECDKAENLKDFEKALEKNCYDVKKISIDENQKSDFLEQFHVTVLGISSYDLEGRNVKNQPISESKLHTELWRYFWRSEGDEKIKGFNVGELRLNPEITIRWRKENKELKDYFRKRTFPEKFKHRQKQDQLTIHFTLSLNAGTIYDNLAFSKPEVILEKIQRFNEKLNKDMDFKNTWKYGIDRGNIELATLCLAQFKEGDFYSVKGENKLKPKFPASEENIKCYTLKDYSLQEVRLTKTEGEKTHFAVKNISYFIKDKYLNNADLFKKENLTCLDLTTAKIVKDTIITNGDIMTYLKLKKSVAKRRIFELYSKNKIKENAKLEWGYNENDNSEKKIQEGVLNIQTNDGKKTIYWYCRRYENIIINVLKNKKYSQENIKNSLTFYLKQLKRKDDKHIPSISRINNLRASITANMVGVICFLQKKYPGFIIMEDLSEKTIQKHFFDHEENISRRLEKALYSKFQVLGLVPPHVKNIIELREKNTNQPKENSKNMEKLKQIGAIYFIPEEYTSKTCPYCEKTSEQSGDLKFNQQRFLCKSESCGFDTYYFKREEERNSPPKPVVDTRKFKEGFKHFENINDPDKVAAFNIAKKSMEKVASKKI